ncbi:YitT family protein [Tenacibaculum finnmarkense genomovar finnmarkense]|uniref:YitT family protein n=1 Tax=Tenacibaculum finnmarkense TaxID=2781243 RepID=UPI001E398B4E|nr:YitT family protein [Tenacibaculum finnmarkense]MCD8401658.1 YitT family protein [Tenacibaculum finnmarkense genomovar finnmarkense]MCD8416156.1 YitT family protein [Tenacibaculum finnmarkense genomovar finnmarkense]MCD8446273.1 YitT family protein [Tenacibaculum finnmarkense genomovar finnmarkense]MCD8453293.1 YitT family protein [Tenacibaculum finnmarkense genomovar ulcerans]MCG8184816.1 YitT family protein [Tenacibaculum finnmarkense genomovar finnmarkense]
MNIIKLKNELKNYFFILSGSLILAIGVVGFLAPNKIATGGTSGLSIVLNYISNIPIGMLLLITNAPLLLISVKYIGKRFAFRTMISIVSLALYIDLFREVFKFPALSDNTLLSTIYGGVCVGLGIGVIFKGDASAGGGAIIARILKDKYDFKPGTVILTLDILIILLSALVFKDLELALWAMLSIFVASKFIDLVVTGRKQNKIVHIASEDLEALKKIIASKMGVSGTLIQGNNLSQSNQRNIIFLSINKNRIMTLKNLVEKHDPEAYMIVLEATELLGSSNAVK